MSKAKVMRCVVCDREPVEGEGFIVRKNDTHICADCYEEQQEALERHKRMRVLGDMTKERIIEILIYAMERTANDWEDDSIAVEEVVKAERILLQALDSYLE